MSQAEEDPELRELVTEALEKSGVLAAVRAHLRAGVFLALEREHEQKCTHHAHLQQILNTHDGRLALLLVHELLEFCRLRHTASVYSAETGQPHTYTYKGRESLLYDLKLTNVDENSHLPVLVQLISLLFKLSKTSPPASHSNSKNTDINVIQSDKIDLVSPDNYDTTFTSDSTNHSLQDRSKVDLQLSLNGSEEIDKSVSDQVEDDKFSSVSEQSLGNDAHIELHTDSDKSYSDNNGPQSFNDPSSIHSEVLSENIDIPNESSINSIKSYDLASIKASLNEISLTKQSNENSEVNLKTDDVLINTIEENSLNNYDDSESNLDRAHSNNPSHMSNNSEHSSEIVEEIIQQDNISESLTHKSSTSNSQLELLLSKNSGHSLNDENSSSSALSTSGGTKLKYSKSNFNRKGENVAKKQTKEDFKGKSQVSNSKVHLNIPEKRHNNKLLQKNNEHLLIHDKIMTSSNKNITSSIKINSDKILSKSSKTTRIENFNGSE